MSYKKPRKEPTFTGKRERYPVVEACKECGQRDVAKYCEPTRSDMVRRQLCFDCLFWAEQLEEHYLKGESVVVDGCHYLVGEESANGWMCGFGGARFDIERFDGTRLTTTNLWHHGQIPGHFRERMPDNARFLEQTEPAGGTYADPKQGKAAR